MHRLCGFLMIGVVAGGCVGPTEPRERDANTAMGLRVWATVSPSSISIHDTAAVLTIRIHARNPSGDSLHIMSGGPPYVFTTDPRDSRGLSYQMRIASATDALNGGPNRDYWGQPVYEFAPRQGWYSEAKVSLREWRAGGWTLASGAYRVRSFYNGHEGTSATFVLKP